MEEAVLGAMLLEFNSEVCLNVVDFLTPEMFFSDANKEIFRAIQEMYKANERVDIITVTEWMNVRKTLKDCGGAYYISQLTNRLASSANIEFHAKVVAQKYALRQIILFGSIAVNRSYNEDPDIFDVFDDIREVLLVEDKLTRGQENITSVGDLMGMEIEDYDMRAALRKQNKSVGTPTGFYQLDREIQGWQDSNLTLVGARPSMGKTAIIIQAVVHACKQGIPCAVFSLETPKIKLLRRILSGEAEVENYRYGRGELTPEEIEKLNVHRSIVGNLPLYIDDDSVLSITQLRTKVRKLYQKQGVRLVVVDYLQLMQGKKEERKNPNREQEISSISRGLKSLAMELNIPVIALSQLSRELEKRNDKRPKLSDLRESGSLEQDADLVLFIHRDEQHGDMVNSQGESTKGKAEVIIAKNKEGELQTVDMEYIGKYTKFVDRSSNQFGGLMPNTRFQEDAF